MGEYKKITKEDIDFPRYCLFFIKRIQDKLDEEDVKERVYTEVLIDTIYPYCSDVFDLVIKTFERKGFDTMTPSFKIEYKFNVKHYIYRWRMRKLSKLDDLPF